MHLHQKSVRSRIVGLSNNFSMCWNSLKWFPKKSVGYQNCRIIQWPIIEYSLYINIISVDYTRHFKLKFCINWVMHQFFFSSNRRKLSIYPLLKKFWYFNFLNISLLFGISFYLTFFSLAFSFQTRSAFNISFSISNTNSIRFSVYLLTIQ